MRRSVPETQRRFPGTPSQNHSISPQNVLVLWYTVTNEADPDAAEPEMEEICPKPYKRRKPAGKKRELSSFETTEVLEHPVRPAVPAAYL